MSLTFRDFEYAGWQQAASVYNNSFAAVAKLFIPPLLDSVSANTGKQLLDVACGTGNVTAQAAERGAIATGVDFSEAMLEQARKQYPDMTFKQAAAEALPFDSESFDAVVINFGVNHFSYPVDALTEAYRVLKPQGSLAFTLWAIPEHNRAWKLVFDAIHSVGDPQIPLPTPPSGAYNRPELCLQLLLDSGFSAQQSNVQMINSHWSVTSAKTLLKILAGGTVRMATMLKAQPPAAATAIEMAINDNLTEYRQELTSGYQVPVAAILAQARKTSS